MAQVPYTTIRFSGSKEEIREKWLEARLNGIGGSDVATILGINKYSSPFELWLIKTKRQAAPDISYREAVEWGTRLEDIVAEKFAEQHPELTVKRKNATLVSKARPWAFANLDRYCIDENKRKGVVEIKTVGLRRASDWDDGVPLYYLTQVTHYLSVTGFDYAWVAVLVGGQEYKEFFVERSEEDIAAINERVDTFWHDNVLADNPPVFIGNQSESDALLRENENFSDDFEEIDREEITGTVDALIAIKQKESEIKQEKTRLENILKDEIGSSKGILTPSHRISWSRSERTKTDLKRLEDDHPDLIVNYQTTSVVNNGLRITERKF